MHSQQNIKIYYCLSIINFRFHKKFYILVYARKHTNLQNFVIRDIYVCKVRVYVQLVCCGLKFDSNITVPINRPWRPTSLSL